MENELDKERELIEEILLGQKELYVKLVERHQSLVYGLIMRQVREPEISQEIAQEVFIKAFQKLDTFQFKSKFSSWLSRICINQINNYFSSRRYKEESKMTCKENISEASNSHDTELLLKLRRSVHSLSEIYREVLILCAFEGHSYAETAEILNIPIGTVRSRLNKARLIIKGRIFSTEVA